MKKYSAVKGRGGEGTGGVKGVMTVRVGMECVRVGRGGGERMR